MTVQLTPETTELIRQKVAAGRYESADALIHDALLALDEYEREEEERLSALHAALAAGEEEGGDMLFTPELVATMERNATEKLRAGHRPNPDVCP